MVTMLKRVHLTIIIITNQPLWPSGLRLHAISQLIIATKEPGFESPLGIMILIAQKYKLFLGLFSPGQHSNFSCAHLRTLHFSECCMATSFPYMI